MPRKTTLAAAAAVTLVLVAGSAAAATNLGLLDSANQTGTVGSLTPRDETATASQPDTVIVEPAPQPPVSVDGGTFAADEHRDDGTYDSDDAYESYEDSASDDERESDHEDEYGGYEGRDDDD